MENEIKCYVDRFYDKSLQPFDCTLVEKQTIYDKDVVLTYVEDAESTGIQFEVCIMLAFPSAESIKKFIPNLTFLHIESSKLSKITSEDLKGYDCLRDLYIVNCEIEYLPADLFKHTPNLEIVSFDSNKIKYIDEGILEPLQDLKIFSLVNNVNINVRYDTKENAGNVTLEQFKVKIMKCKPQKNAELKRKYEELSGKFAELSSENEKSKKMCLDQAGKIENLEKKLETVLQQYDVIKEVSKDFTIEVEKKHFMVHKAVLIAHSQVIAKLIADNPGTAILELKDTSAATFQEILNFMNDGSPPNEDANMVKLFEGSCRLEIHALTAIVAEILKEEVNQANALDVLVLCNKFNLYDELKMKAFGEFEKNFPNQLILPEFASQPKKLKKLMQAKLEMEKMLAEMHQTALPH